MSESPHAVEFAASGWRGSSVPGRLPWILSTLLPEPERVARAGEILRESRYRVTARIEDAAGDPLLLKVHRVRKRREAWLSRVRRSRASEEWDACLWLADHGLPAADPLAFGELRAGGRLEAAFLLTTWLEGHVAYRKALESAAGELRAHLLEAMGALIRRMHDAGFDHLDLHAENVLVGDAGRGELVLVDLHRHRRGVDVSAPARVRAVGQLVHDLGDGLGADDAAKLLAAYGGGIDGRAVEEDVRRRERIRRRSRARRCLLESTVYTRDVGTSYRGARRRALSTARLAETLASHDAALGADDERVLKRGGRSAVTRHGDLVVKEAFARSTLGAWRSRLVPGRSSSGYRNAHLLDVLGVATARPIAWVTSGPRAFTLYEDLSSLRRLDLCARTLYRADDPRAARLRDASAAWLADLHRRGIYHGDLKGVNILVREDEGTFAFPLIDTDRVLVFDHAVDRRRRVKNLAQLAASVPVCVTKTERLRWYRRYAERLGLPEDERRLARDVGALLAKKILVVDKPIE